MLTRLLALSVLALGTAFTGTAYAVQHSDPCQQYRDTYARHYDSFMKQQADLAHTLAACYEQELHSR